ncbi:MAG: hypothetical protein P1S46_10820 [bacterium]|nr:hypothetical protein [bacterium]MDT8396595.1 hypothetical protein [bacterium]
MVVIRTSLAIAVSIAILAVSGCVTSDGRSNRGWVVIGDTTNPPPRTGRDPEPHPGKGKGLDVAARNHIRSAYRFLKNDKPDHALRELEKARGKMDSDFWYHYYLGGAYYMKGMHSQARDSWEMAYRFTQDYRLRSRIRTCQSFVVFRIQGQQPTLGFLRNAVDMDLDNGTARGLLDDLFADREHPESRSGSGGDQPAFVRDMLENSKYETSDEDKDNDRHNDSDGRETGPGKKGGPGHDKKSKDKEKKRYRIEDNEQFAAYFFVEMP